MSDVPISSVTQVVNVIMSVPSGAAGIIDSSAQAIKTAVNDGMTATTISNAGQVAASTVGLMAAIGIVSAPVAVGVTAVALAITITKNIYDITQKPNQDINLGDVIGVVGNAASIIGGLIPGSSVIAVGMNTVGAVTGAAGIIENNVGGGLAGIINPPTDSIKSAIDDFIKPRRKDPLTLDLDGNGLDTIGISSVNPLMFDHDGDGIKSGTGWVKPADGFLALDRNENGAIDNGTELFGDSTPTISGLARDGFDALSALDSNADNIIDALDTQWNQLIVWQDENQDANSQQSELKGLDEVGIVAISLKKVDHNLTLANGNQIADMGTFVWADGNVGVVGTIGHMADINLALDTFHTVFPDRLPIKSGLLSLPDIYGSGLVRSLREAASSDSNLEEVYVRISNLHSGIEQDALIDELLWRWAATAGLKSSSDNFSKSSSSLIFQALGSAELPREGDSLEEIERWSEAYVTFMQRLPVLEAFFGRNFYSVEFDPDTLEKMYFGPGISSIVEPWGAFAQVTVRFSQVQLDQFNNAYDMLREFVYQKVALTRLSPLFTKVVVESGSNGEAKLNFSSLEQYFDIAIQSSGSVDELKDLIDFCNYSGFNSNEGWGGRELLAKKMSSLILNPELSDAYEILGIAVEGTSKFGEGGGSQQDLVIGAENSSTIHGNDGHDIIVGKGGDDVLFGDNGNDILFGDVGNDIIKGGLGSDHLVGGAGNDILDGGAGSDTYMFTSGFGQDVLVQNDISSSRQLDVAKFTDLKSTDVESVLRQGQDLVARFNTGDQLTLKDFYYIYTGVQFKVDQLQFSDGVTWNVDQIKSLTVTPGTSGNDILTAFDGGPNDLRGLAGNDTLTGGDSTDRLDGGEGDDILKGYAGNDTLIGGAGNDTLDGSFGNDTFLFSRGFGQDLLIQNETTTGRLDVVRFSDLNSTDLTQFVRLGNNLVARFDSGDQLTLKDYYYIDAGVQFKVDQIQFADGVTWDPSQVKLHTMTLGTEGDDTITGISTAPTDIRGLGGNDNLNGGTNADKIDGGDGDDVIKGDAGDDTLYGGAGNDNLHGGAGVDVLISDVGNDTLNGGDGSDTYLFTSGFGQDVLVQNDISSSRQLDVAKFTDLKSTDVESLLRQGKDLVARFNTGDQLTLKDFYYIYTGVQFKVNQLQFSDGVTWNVDQIKSLTVTPGTSGNDILTAFDGGPNDLRGLAGNDTLNGGDSTDRLDGGEGDDILKGYAGNDTLIGGAGNDTLDGSFGNDTFLFSRGFGQDLLIQNETTTGRLDVVRFSDLNSTDLAVFGRSGNNLVARFNSGDQLTLKDYYYIDAGVQFKVDQIQFADGVTWDPSQVKLHTMTLGTEGDDTITGISTAPTDIRGLGGNDTLNGGTNADKIDGGDGDDVIKGDAGDDTLYGGAGNDNLHGGAGVDMLISDVGNDTLNGGDGSDTYLFTSGFGQDVLVQNDISSSRQLDVAKFTDLKSTDVESLLRQGKDLVARFNTGDQLTLKDFYYIYTGVQFKVNQLQFSDGVTWNVDQIKSLTVTPGTSGNDILTAFDGGPNDLRGLAGNDTLNGGDSTDRLDGGEGDDILKGYAGNDTLIGGAGNDTLDGSFGNDTFLFSRGFGQDLLIQNETTTGRLDVVKFSDLNSTDLAVFGRSGNDLVARFNSGDQLTLKDFYYTPGSQYKINQVEFADGTIWTQSQILSNASVSIIGQAGESLSA